MILKRRQQMFPKLSKSAPKPLQRTKLLCLLIYLLLLAKRCIVQKQKVRWIDKENLKGLLAFKKNHQIEEPLPACKEDDEIVALRENLEHLNSVEQIPIKWLCDHFKGNKILDIPTDIYWTTRAECYRNIAKYYVSYLLSRRYRGQHHNRYQ